jgi:hypothetical protein
VSVTVAVLFSVMVPKTKSPAISSVEVYALAPLPPKLSTVLAFEVGTPVGLQFVDTFQFPVVGAVVVPAGPSHAGSPPAGGAAMLAPLPAPASAGADAELAIVVVLAFVVLAATVAMLAPLPATGTELPIAVVLAFALPAEVAVAIAAVPAPLLPVVPPD